MIEYLYVLYTDTAPANTFVTRTIFAHKTQLTIISHACLINTHIIHALANYIVTLQVIVPTKTTYSTDHL